MRVIDSNGYRSESCEKTKIIVVVIDGNNISRLDSEGEN